MPHKTPCSWAHDRYPYQTSWVGRRAPPWSESAQAISPNHRTRLWQWWSPSSLSQTCWSQRSSWNLAADSVALFVSPSRLLTLRFSAAFTRFFIQFLDLVVARVWIGCLLFEIVSGSLQSRIAQDPCQPPLLSTFWRCFYYSDCQFCVVVLSGHYYLKLINDYHFARLSSFQIIMMIKNL